MSDDSKKMEAIIDKGVRLKKGIAMGGMESASNVDHSSSSKAPKMAKPAQLAKRNKGAY